MKMGERTAETHFHCRPFKGRYPLVETNGNEGGVMVTKSTFIAVPFKGRNSALFSILFCCDIFLI
jgi:hypothetical protein